MMLWKHSETVRVALGAVVGALVLCAAGAASAQAPAPAPGEGGVKVCGTIVGLACGDGMFCEFAAGECETADSAGVCVQVPAMCTKQWEPVCSCPDATHSTGRTHGNDCERRASLEQKAHDGECASPTP